MTYSNVYDPFTLASLITFIIKVHMSPRACPAAMKVLNKKTQITDHGMNPSNDGSILDSLLHTCAHASDFDCCACAWVAI